MSYATAATPVGAPAQRAPQPEIPPEPKEIKNNLDNELMRDLRQRYSGQALVEAIVKEGRKIIESGDADQIFRFMMAVDVPAANRVLAVMAATKIDVTNASRFVEICGQWYQEPEGAMISHIFLGKVAELQGLATTLDQVRKTVGSANYWDAASSALSGAVITDPGALEYFVKNEPSTASHIEYLANAINSLSRNHDPAAAWKALEGFSKRDGVEVVTSIAAGSNGASPEKYVAFLSQKNGMNDQSKGLIAASFATGWAGTDPKATSEWIATLAPGVIKDKAIYGMLNGLSNGRIRSPEAAGWLGQIGDEAIRKSAARFIQP